MHCFVPIAGMFNMMAMYVHVGFCFSVHVLHLSESYLVFKDIKMQDRSYIFILWAVNVMEFAVNISYCFPDQIPSKYFIIPMLVTEISAQLLSSLKLKPLHNPHHHATTTSSATATITSHDAPAESQNWYTSIQTTLTSRISIAVLCASTVGTSIGFHQHEFALFISGLSVLFSIILLHFHRHTADYHDALTRWSMMIVPIAMTTFAWLGDLAIVPRYIVAILVLTSSLPLVVLILLKFHRIMGNHYTFQMSLIGGLVYILSVILHAVHFHDPRYHRAATVCTVSFVMAIMLTDMKLVKGKRVHVMNLSESKNSINQSAVSNPSHPSSSHVDFSTPVVHNGPEKL